MSTQLSFIVEGITAWSAKTSTHVLIVIAVVAWVAYDSGRSAGIALERDRQEQIHQQQASSRPAWLTALNNQADLASTNAILESAFAINSGPPPTTTMPKPAVQIDQQAWLKALDEASQEILAERAAKAKIQATPQ